jgi:hypothetical protein
MSLLLFLFGFPPPPLSWHLGICFCRLIIIPLLSFIKWTWNYYPLHQLWILLTLKWSVIKLGHFYNCKNYLSVLSSCSWDSIYHSSSLNPLPINSTKNKSRFTSKWKSQYATKKFVLIFLLKTLKTFVVKHSILVITGWYFWMIW